MTNIQTIAGGFVWSAIAGILMLVTFQPVGVEQKAPNAPLELAKAPAAAEASI